MVAALAGQLRPAASLPSLAYVVVPRPYVAYGSLFQLLALRRTTPTAASSRGTPDSPHSPAHPPPLLPRSCTLPSYTSITEP